MPSGINLTNINNGSIKVQSVDTSVNNYVLTLPAVTDTLAGLTSPAFIGIPTALTAVAGTNTTQLATTAFVTTADNLKANSSTIGNLGTQGASAVSFTLTQAISGKMQVATAGITITLPPINTIVSGSIFILKGAGGVSTIALNGNASELTRLTILVGETVALQSDGSSYYRVLYRSSEYSSNIGINGYSYLPNGLLMQWGTYSGSITTGGGVLNVTFPVTFPVNVFYSNVAVVSLGVNAQATIPTCVATTTSNLAITNNDVDSPITQLRWFSIGF